MDAVQHFELPYKNRDRAKKFYFQAFGWQVFDLPGSTYSLANSVDTEKNGMPKRPGAINGGLLPRSKEVTAPTFFVKVKDLEAHLQRVRHAGGTLVTPPTAMGPVWFARFRDTEGNLLGAVQDRPEGQEAGAGAGRKAKPAKKAKAKPRKAATSGKAKPAKAKPKRKAREAKATWSR